MNIVHIEDFFHPDAGYQINILPKYMVQHGHQVTIITSQMDLIPEELTNFFGRNNVEEADQRYTNDNGVKIIRLPLKMFISSRAVFGKVLDKTILSLNPDVVYVHGNDTVTGMHFIRRVKKWTFALVTDSHMLEMASTNKLNKLFRWYYRKVITPRILKYKIPVIRTQNDPYVEKCLGIPLDQSPWISYGSDTLLFHPDETVKNAIREKHAIGKDDFVVIYTGKLTESKGGKFLAKAFEKHFNSARHVILLVVGNTNGTYGEEVEMIFKKSENRVIRVPTQKYQDLPQYYQAADLCVFAKQCSLSFYDAQACGLPVVSEDNNINVERNSHGNGLCFKSNDITSFRMTIEKIVNLSDAEFSEMIKNSLKLIHENYDYEEKAKEYEKVIADAYEGFNKGKN